MLGKGGFGMTYVGIDLLLETKVAIKECYPGVLCSRNNAISNKLEWNISMTQKDQWRSSCESFLKEARKMAKMRDIPEVVRVQDTFEENMTAYIVMEFVEGITLKQHLEKNGTMKPNDCIELLRPIMNALCSVHHEGFVHRDISPDNIMIQPDGRLRLLDLGAAKEFTKDSSGHSELVVKKGFSPIEQYAETGNIGPWTDVYALCATMYYCMIGKLAPDALDRIDGSLVEFPAAKLQEPMTAAMSSALQAGLVVDPKQRIQSIEELLKRLSGSKRSSLKLAPIIIAVVAVLTVLSVIIIAFNRPKPAPDPVLKGDITLKKPDVSLKPFGEDTKGKSEKLNYLQPTSIKNGKAVSPLKELDDRYTVTHIGFRDSMENVSDDAIDVSLNGDGSVLAWVVGTHLIVAADGNIAITDASSLFYNFSDLEEVYFYGNVDTSEVTSMNAMFANCVKLKTVNLHGINTENVTDMSYMFDSCTSLSEFDGIAFNTENVTDMSNMFSECSGLIKLDLSGFDTSKVTNMSSMFKNCGALSNLNIKNFKRLIDTDVTDMFSGCSSILTAKSSIPGDFLSLVPNSTLKFNGVQ